MTNPVMDNRLPPGMADVSTEALLASSPGMADVSREAPLGGFRAEASIMGNTSAYADTAGYGRWPPTVGADTRGDVS